MEVEDLSFWLSWCIEEYAHEKQLAAPDVAERFEREGVLSYLAANAEILHTQGKGYIIGCIEDFLEKEED